MPVDNYMFTVMQAEHAGSHIPSWDILVISCSLVESQTCPGCVHLTLAHRAHAYGLETAFSLLRLLVKENSKPFNETASET